MRTHAPLARIHPSHPAPADALAHTRLPLAGFCPATPGGYVEFSIKLPGNAVDSGLWAAAWMNGNLGRAGHLRSTEGMVRRWRRRLCQNTRAWRIARGHACAALLPKATRCCAARLPDACSGHTATTRARAAGACPGRSSPARRSAPARTPKVRACMHGSVRAHSSGSSNRHTAAQRAYAHRCCCRRRCWLVNPPPSPHNTCPQAVAPLRLTCWSMASSTASPRLCQRCSSHRSRRPSPAGCCQSRRAARACAGCTRRARPCRVRRRAWARPMGTSTALAFPVRVRRRAWFAKGCAHACGVAACCMRWGVLRTAGAPCDSAAAFEPRTALARSFVLTPLPRHPKDRHLHRQQRPGAPAL